MSNASACVLKLGLRIATRGSCNLSHFCLQPSHAAHSFRDSAVSSGGPKASYTAHSLQQPREPCLHSADRLIEHPSPACVFMHSLKQSTSFLCPTLRRSSILRPSMISAPRSPPCTRARCAPFSTSVIVVLFFVGASGTVLFSLLSSVKSEVSNMKKVSTSKNLMGKVDFIGFIVLLN